MKEFVRTRLAPLWLRAGGSKGAVFLLDLFVLALAVYLSFALRLTLFIPPAFRPDMAIAWCGFSLSVAAAFTVFGVYRVHWPQASLEEFALLCRAYALGAFLFVLVERFVPFFFVPRSSLAVLILAGLVALGFLRVTWRLALASLRCAPADEKDDRAFIIGAGEAGTLLARDLLRSGSSLRPVAFFDDDERKQGKVIATLPVLGAIAALPQEAARLGVSHVVIAMPSLPGTRIREILDLLKTGSFQVRVIPGLQDLAGGKVSISALRKVNLEDLLRREPISLDVSGIRAFVEKRAVLVTGAGGSIGSEICRQLLRYGPERLLLVGHGEHSIYTLLEELRDDGVKTPLIPLIADVADVAAMRRIFSAHRPQVVFHAAAHKHVPLMERNAAEALRVNVLGTAAVAGLAGEFGASRMVMISTDKAVNPTSVMGVTKRVAELIVQDAARRTERRFVAVRFGNVLGSRGSVVPVFQEQIARGGPVTVTHPDMTRFFMTIPEASQLVLQAAAFGRGGEVFILDMGEPVRIIDLARDLIALSGYQEGRDIDIVFTGLRPGEKPYEELFRADEECDRTVHKRIFAARGGPERPSGALGQQVGQLIRSARDGDASGVRRVLRDLVPEYTAGAAHPVGGGGPVCEAAPARGGVAAAQPTRS